MTNPNFVRDDTPLWTDKVEVNPAPVTNQGWGAAEAGMTKDGLEGIRDYLQSGVLDASASVTLPALTTATATVTTANIANANVTALVAADLNLINNLSSSVGPEMDWVGHRGDWFIGVDVANAPTSRDFVLTGQRGSYAFDDGSITSGSAVVTSASTGGFTTALVGASVAGIGIPVGATVLSVAGPTSLTMTTNATATATGVNIVITSNGVQDLLYWRHRGALSATLGIGVTPPDGSARVQVSAQDSEPAMGTIRLRVGPSQTGKAATVFDSGGTDRWWVDKDFYISGDHPTGGALVVRARPATPGPTDARALVMADDALSNFYGFVFEGGNECTFRCISGGNDSFKVAPDGALRHLSTKIGLYGVAAVTRQTVVALTDNTAGTADGTLQALPNPADTPATADALRDDIVANLLPALRNDLADLAAKINEIRTALVNLGALQ